MTYSEMLRHPMWQRKRLEALEREGFACAVCCDDESPLHVHHRRYIKGRKPWEYGADDLVVLCDECHEAAHAIKDKHLELLAHTHAMHDNDMLAAATAFSLGLAVGCPLPKEDIDRIREAAPMAFTVGCIAALSMDYTNPQATLDTLLRAFLAKDQHTEAEWDMLVVCCSHLKQRGAHPQKWAEDGLLALVPAAQEEAA